MTVLDHQNDHEEDIPVSDNLNAYEEDVTVLDHLNVGYMPER